MKKLILLFMMGFIFTIGCSKTSNEFKVELVSDAEIPVFNLYNLEGKRYTSKELMDNGKKTLFVMGAEWCPHCKAEIPHVQKFYNENKDKVNVVVVFSSVRSELEEVKKYIKDNGYDMPVYFDNDDSILNGFSIEAFPFNLKINGNKLEKVLQLPVDYNKLTFEFSN